MPCLIASLTCAERFLHFDGTERFLCHRRKVSQVKFIEGNPQERSHGERSLCLHTKERKLIKIRVCWRLADISHPEKLFVFFPPSKIVEASLALARNTDIGNDIIQYSLEDVQNVTCVM